MKYKKENSESILEVDRSIKNVKVELQELRYKNAIENSKLIIDTLSCFYFKNKEKVRKKVKITDQDLDIKKMGKLYTLENEDLYLIYIKKENFNPKENFTSISDLCLTSENYIFIPLKIKELRNTLNKDVDMIVNNKIELKDTLESAFNYLKVEKNHIYSLEELKKVFNIKSTDTTVHIQKETTR